MQRKQEAESAGATTGRVAKRSWTKCINGIKVRMGNAWAIGKG